MKPEKDGQPLVKFVPGQKPAPLAFVGTAFDVLDAGAARHPVDVYLENMGSPDSRRTMRSALKVIARALTTRELSEEDQERIEMIFPWPLLRYTHTSELRAKLGARSLSVAYVNKLMCALRGVLTECWRLDLMTSEDQRRACDVKALRGSRVGAGRALAKTEIVALFHACDAATLAGSRDAAILSLLYGCGLRRSEVAKMARAAIDLETGEVRVLGKGNKERLVHAVGGGLAALAAWIDKRGDHDGALFVAVNAGGNADLETGAPLTDKSVARILTRLVERAQGKAATPHDLRRTFISDLLDAGADISAAQQLAGHGSPTTTQRYDRRGERVKRAAAAMIHVPFPEDDKP